jgi:beta-glucosidase
MERNTSTRLKLIPSLEVKFPSGFLWGAAISSYQTEGGNLNSDWYLWEKEKKITSCGRASNHYELFKDDFRLVKELNLKSLRMSLEWARISPQKGIYSDQVLLHYKESIELLKSLGIKPFVVLHHFTNPIWFSEPGGWSSSKNIDHFLEYLKVVVNKLKRDVYYWQIINEPMVYLFNGYVAGVWPPGVKSLTTAKKVLNNLISAYRDGYQEIKNIYKQEGLECNVSFAKHIRRFAACPSLNFGQNFISSSFRDKVFNIDLLDYLSAKRCLDSIAVNYYCKEYVKFNSYLGSDCSHPYHKERKNFLGWYVYPRGLYEFLKRFKKYKLPIFITENGTAELSDSLYEEYLLSHLKSVARAISEGIDIKGYFWWSLIDNFEWDKGFGPRFGLIEVDYDNFKRKIKPFAYTYAKICKENRIEV